MTTAPQLPALYSESGLSDYLDKINRFPFLEPEEELSLAREWHEKQNLASAHKLMTSHLRLVAKIAFGYRGYGLPVTDLIAEGNIGLMQAIKKFDPEKGFRLSTYAMWWIKAAIQEYILRSWSLVKLGTTSAQKKLFFNLKRLKAKIQNGNDRALSDEEAGDIAEELNVKQEEVLDMEARLFLTDKSIDESLYHDDDGDNRSFADTLSNDEASQETVLAEREEAGLRAGLMHEAIENALNHREQTIIRRRRLVAEDETAATLEDLSGEYGISRERVRQIEARAMEKIREYIETRL